MKPGGAVHPLVLGVRSVAATLGLVVVTVFLARLFESLERDRFSWAWFEWRRWLGLAVLMGFILLPWPVLLLALTRARPLAARPIGPRLLVIAASQVLALILGAAFISAVDLFGLGGEDYELMVFTGVVITAGILLPTVVFPWKKRMTATEYVASAARGSCVIGLGIGAAHVIGAASGFGSLYDPLFMILGSLPVTGMGLIMLRLTKRLGRDRMREWSTRCYGCGYDVQELSDCPECGRSPARSMLVSASTAASASNEPQGS